MLKASALAVAAGVMLAGSAAATTQLRLHWNDCSLGASAQSVTTFLCDDDTSHFRLVGSFVPDVDLPLVYLQATIDMEPCGGADPSSWWQMQDEGCRAGSLSATATVPGSTCPNPWPASVLVLVADRYPFASSTTNASRVSVACIVPAADSIHLAAGTEVTAFQIVIDSRHTTSADAPRCTGCEQSVCFAWWECTIGWGSNSDQQIYVRSANATAAWRCPTTAAVDIGTGTPHGSLGGGIVGCTLGECPVDTRRATWGRVRSLYR